MATGNTAYAIAAAGYTGQPAYSAVATEISVTKKWENAWLRKFPLVSFIKENKGNFNKGMLRKGNTMLCPIILGNATTTADGVADSAELTGITPYITANLTQAAYEIAHYRNAFYIRESEMQLINNTRGNHLEGVTQQLVDGFVNALADDMASTNADSRTAVLGVQQVLSTSNTVGGIAQGTDTDWAAQVTTAAGAFSLDLIDDKMDAVNPRNGNTDLILLAYASGVNLFGKLRAALAPAERIVNANFKAKYGFTNIEYLGALCISENRFTSGVICGLDTSSWFYMGDTAPKLVGIDRYPGTDAMEHMYNMWASLGCNNPAKNWRLTGVS